MGRPSLGAMLEYLDFAGELLCGLWAVPQGVVPHLRHKLARLDPGGDNQISCFCVNDRVRSLILSRDGRVFLHEMIRGDHSHKILWESALPGLVTQVESTNLHYYLVLSSGALFTLTFRNEQDSDPVLAPYPITPLRTIIHHEIRKSGGRRHLYYGLTLEGHLCSMGNGVPKPRGRVLHAIGAEDGEEFAVLLEDLSVEVWLGPKYYHLPGPYHWICSREIGGGTFWLVLTPPSGPPLWLNPEDLEYGWE